MRLRQSKEDMELAEAMTDIKRPLWGLLAVAEEKVARQAVQRSLTKML